MRDDDSRRVFRKGWHEPAKEVCRGERAEKLRDVPAYIAAQIVGAFAGVAAAHLMFGLSLFFASHHARRGGSQLFSEFVNQ